MQGVGEGASFIAHIQEASCSDPAIEQFTEKLKTIGREKEVYFCSFWREYGGVSSIGRLGLGLVNCIRVTAALYDHTVICHMATALTLFQPFSDGQMELKQNHIKIGEKSSMQVYVNLLT